MGLVKSISKTVKKAAGGATKGIAKTVSNTVKDASAITKAVSKGDLKGAAAAGMGAVTNLKDAIKDNASGQLGLASGLGGALGQLTGSRDISNLSSNIDAEGNRGIAKYGDTAIDLGANTLTGGGYGVAQAAAAGLANKGFNAFTDPKLISQMATSSLASQAGVDPRMVAAAQGFSTGGLKGAAIQGAGSAAGLSPTQQAMAGSAIKGDLKAAALQQAGSMGMDPTLGGIINKGSFNVQDLAKNANLTAAIGGALPGQAYLPGGVQDMIKQGQSAGRVVQSADAYAKDIQNGNLDSISGAVRDMAGNTPLGQAAKAASTVIQKGETLSSIAKKNGISVAALLAANPNIKDPNKIAAGLNLNLPSSATSAVNSADLAARKLASDQAEIARATAAQEPSMWDNIKSGVSNAASSVGSAITNNPNAANALLQGAAGIGGYMVGNKARDEQEALIKKQILETQGVDALSKYTLSQDREKAYADQQQFLGDRISGGGFTAKEKAMQAEGQLRAARAAAAGRMAGVEQQARMGQGTTGAGSSLASSLIGAQAGANTQADIERQAAMSASDNLNQAYGARTGALETKAATEMNLAQSQDSLDLQKQSQLAFQRKQQADLAAAQGQATGNLISQGANLGSSLIYSNSTQAQNDQQYNDQMRQAALTKANNEANGMVLPQVTQQTQQPAPQTANRAPASNQQVPQQNQNTAKGGALASLANPQGSTGVLAPAPTSTTPAQDAMNKFLTVSSLPKAAAVIANPQAAAQKAIADKAAQAKALAAKVAADKVKAAQDALAAKAKSALPASVGSAASKLISGFKSPF